VFRVAAVLNSGVCVSVAAALCGVAVAATMLWALNRSAHLSRRPLSTVPSALSNTRTPAGRCADSYALIGTYVGTIENGAPRVVRKLPYVSPRVPWLPCSTRGGSL